MEHQMCLIISLSNSSVNIRFVIL